MAGDNKYLQLVFKIPQGVKQLDIELSGQMRKSYGSHKYKMDQINQPNQAITAHIDEGLVNALNENKEQIEIELIVTKYSDNNSENSSYRSTGFVCGKINFKEHI